MSAHDPGPWWTERGPGLQTFIINDTRDLVACVYGSHNARLVASAPKLLEALKDVVKIARCPCPAAEAVIAEVEDRK